MPAISHKHLHGRVYGYLRSSRDFSPVMLSPEVRLVYGRFAAISETGRE